MNAVFLFPQDCAVLAFANPLSSADHHLASWFHARLTQPFANLLGAFSGPGSAAWIGIVLACAVLFFLRRQRWFALVTLLLAVPGGMLLNELLKVAVQRQRPFLDGPFVDWSGYSFASGHTIGATLLYGWLVCSAMPAIKQTHLRVAAVAMALLLILLVGFSRIALGAHYLTDVLAAMVFGTAWLTLCLMAAGAIRRPPARIGVPAEISPDAGR